jgi:hypothetical protein
VKTGRRLFLASAAAAVSLPVIGWLLSEATVYYYMFISGMSARAELAGDLGVGILLFMVVPLGTLFGTVSVWFFTWYRIAGEIPFRVREK